MRKDVLEWKRRVNNSIYRLNERILSSFDAEQLYAEDQEKTDGRVTKGW